MEVRLAYAGIARWVAGGPWLVMTGYVVTAAAVIGFVGPRLGTDIFPRTEAGQLQARLRAPAGTQIDGTEALALQTRRTV